MHVEERVDLRRDGVRAHGGNGFHSRDSAALGEIYGAPLLWHGYKWRVREDTTAWRQVDGENMAGYRSVRTRATTPEDLKVGVQGAASAACNFDTGPSAASAFATRSLNIRPVFLGDDELPRALEARPGAPKGVVAQ
ncbi:hypothetical protein ON010_g47 [Phytophthora cinnamomi]|nr:hypothetical protein ON010_g47 [Phytophthora cinnamomi]